MGGGARLLLTHILTKLCKIDWPVSMLAQPLWQQLLDWQPLTANVQAAILAENAVWGLLTLRTQSPTYCHMVQPVVGVFSQQLSTEVISWGCRYGVGSRIKLRYTRSIITAIHSGELAAADVSPTPIFELQVRAQVIVSKPAGQQKNAQWQSFLLSAEG